MLQAKPEAQLKEKNPELEAQQPREETQLPSRTQFKQR